MVRERIGGIFDEDRSRLVKVGYRNHKNWDESFQVKLSGFRLGIVVYRMHLYKNVVSASLYDSDMVNKFFRSKE
jgi:hypothetical protein